jgi:hypothetical protein
MKRTLAGVFFAPASSCEELDKTKTAGRRGSTERQLRRLYTGLPDKESFA